MLRAVGRETGDALRATRPGLAAAVSKTVPLEAARVALSLVCSSDLATLRESGDASQLARSLAGEGCLLGVANAVALAVPTASLRAHAPAVGRLDAAVVRALAEQELVRRRELA